jgi:hypothetical protein
MGTVTDGAEGVCVDPGEMGAILEAGDPTSQQGEKAGSWHQTVEEDRHNRMPQNTGDRLVTTPSHVYVQSKCPCALYSYYRANNHNRNHVLVYYLFQENKSFGRKKPFAFILWCTGSCVEHRYCLAWMLLFVSLAWGFRLHTCTHITMKWALRQTQLD